MQVIIKHPTNPNIDFVINLKDSIAATMTIVELLKTVEDVFMRINEGRKDLDFSKYWKLRSCKTNKYMSNISKCSDIDTDDNNFTVCWGPGDVKKP